MEKTLGRLPPPPLAFTPVKKKTTNNRMTTNTQANRKTEKEREWERERERLTQVQNKNQGSDQTNHSAGHFKMPQRHVCPAAQ